jgi:hypothetical protein
MDSIGRTGCPARAALRATGIAVGGVALSGGIAALTYSRWRPWCLTWGATDEEATEALPGDELLEDPDLISTRAISIAAPKAAVWPWLAQMGSGRGGLYTYDWIENLLGLHMHSVDVILPQFQEIEIGDAQRLGTGGPTLRVAVAEPEAALVLRSDDGNWVWAFCLVSTVVGTRLISRNRIAVPGASSLSRAFYRYLMEPGSLIMERRMLIGIRERAERPAGEEPETAVRTGARPE